MLVKRRSFHVSDTIIGQEHEDLHSVPYTMLTYNEMRKAIGDINKN